ncbi:RIP metalloprotease RseP [Verrucomicrobiota bacterium sgz303538]
MFLKALNFLLIAFEVVLIFNLIIIVHELGHFLAARWRGLVVDEFGVWFGKALWKKKINGVWYSLGSVPAGGFVKLPQMAPMETIEGESETPREQLPPVKPLDKIIVAFAGPLFSFLLALAMATIVWGIGKPTNDIENTTTIGYVQKDGPADRAGLKVGDKILEVDGRKVRKFFGPLESITWRIIRSEGDTIPFKVERDGQILDIPVGWAKEETASWKRKSLRKVLIGPRITPQVGKVDKGSPAEAAGLKEGDIITSVNGQPSFNLDTVIEVLSKNVGQPVALTIDRSGQKVESTITPVAAKPAKPDEEPLGADIGVEWGKIELVHPGPWQQVVDAVMTIRNMVDALVSPKSDVKAQHFSGPVGIMKVYYQLFEVEQGWRLAIAFSVFFNVNLAILNMLPFPVLDGGHITLALIETVRRRPVNTRALEVVQTACAVALIGFMLYVTFFDVGDFFRGKPRASTEQKQEATPAPAK